MKFGTRKIQPHFMAEIVKPSNDMVDILGSYDTETIFEVMGNIYDNPELLKQ